MYHMWLAFHILKNEKAHINEEKAVKIPSYLQEILPVLFLGISLASSQGHAVQLT